MANIHTNFLTGNDTTGDGSTTLPYKTISKALTVAVNGDEIRVAGGEFQAIAGATVTVGVRSTQITTSTDLTSQFALGDSIFLDTFADDGFPMQANGNVVTAITATTITCANNFAMKAGTYTPHKLSVYHYAGTAQTYETITTVPATDLTIEGGWNSDFSAQTGWTGVKNTAAGLGGTFIGTWNSLIKPSIVFDRLLFSNITTALSGSSSSIGINEVVFNRTTNPFGTSNFGVYAPSSVGFSTIYSYGTNLGGGWNGGGNRPTTLQLKQWQTSVNTSTGIKCGFAVSEGAVGGPSIRTLEAYWRSTGSVSNVSEWAPIMHSNMGDIFVDQLNMYIGGTCIHPIVFDFGTANAWKWIGNIDVYNIDGTRSGITPFRSTLNSGTINNTGPFNLNRTSGTFEQLPWMFYGSQSPIYTVYANARACMFGKDTEDQKVITNDSIVKYADPVEYITGSNSLRQKIITNTAGVDFARYMAANLTKPSDTTPFTITIKAKASKTITFSNNAGNNVIELQFGQSISSFAAITANRTTIPTTWVDIIITVNPTSITNWNLGDDGLMQVLIPINSTQIANQNEIAYLYIDSVTVS